MVKKWRFIDLGGLDPLATQAVYEAVGVAIDAGKSPNTLILCYPKKPFVSIGYSQELERSVEVSYCKENSIPIGRRILGGGTVYLNKDQLFYQVIANKRDPEVPLRVDDVFKKFLEPTVKTYRDIGIDAYYRQVNDIEVNGKKISGNGAGAVGKAIIMTGNIIFDFDYDSMVKILKVPSIKFRDKLAKGLRERLTTVKKELGVIPSEDEVKSLLLNNFENTIGVKLEESTLTEFELEKLDETLRKYATKKWLNLIRLEHSDLIQKRELKITGRSRIGEAMIKAPGGVVDALVESLDDRIDDIMITGDFQFIPSNEIKRLEEALKGARIAYEEVQQRVNEFYNRSKVQSPGLVDKHIADVVIQATNAEKFGYIND